jgi:hypothetical protein
VDSGITVNPSLDISTRTVGGMTIAELAGELDIARAPALREQLLSLLRPGSSRLVIGLSKRRHKTGTGARFSRQLLTASGARRR